MNNHLSSGWSKGIAALGLAALSAGLQLPAFGQRYTVTNVGTLFGSRETINQVNAISSDGSKIVGEVNNGGSLYDFYWDGSMHNIGPSVGAPRYVTPVGLVLIGNPASVWTLGGGSVALPMGGLSGGVTCMNDSGVIGGNVDDRNTVLGYNCSGGPIYARLPTRWERDGSGHWSYINLGLLPGHNAGAVRHIDSNGNLIGNSEVGTVSTATDIHVVLWSPSDGFVPHDLGQPSTNPLPFAFQTNPTTLSTQYLYAADPNQSWYTNGIKSIQLVGTDTVNPYSSANGLNASGQVGGTGGFAGARHAYYWDTSFISGAVMDLGVLPGGTSSQAPGYNGWTGTINESGFIIGRSLVTVSKNSTAYKAFVSTPASRLTSAKLLDLNTLLNNALSSVGLTSLTQALVINDNGYILCYATTSSGLQRVARLTLVQ